MLTFSALRPPLLDSCELFCTNDAKDALEGMLQNGVEDKEVRSICAAVFNISVGLSRRFH